MMFLLAGHSAGLLSKNFVKQRLHEIFRIPAPWLTKEMIFVCTVFLSFTLWMTCERTIIHAQLPYELHHKICNLRYGTHGYGMSAYEGMAKINFNRMK